VLARLTKTKGNLPRKGLPAHSPPVAAVRPPPVLKAVLRQTCIPCRKVQRPALIRSSAPSMSRHYRSRLSLRFPQWVSLRSGLKLGGGPGGALSARRCSPARSSRRQFLQLGSSVPPRFAISQTLFCLWQLGDEGRGVLERDEFSAVGQGDRIFKLAGPIRRANGASPSCRPRF
jgi:hypothetical protein